MNINRLFWLAMTLLCCVVGGLVGAQLGAAYTSYKIGVSPLVPSSLAAVTVATFSLGTCIILARVGSWLADRVIAGLARVHQISAADRILGIIGVLLGMFFGAMVTLVLNVPQFGAWNVPQFGAWMVLVKLCVLLVSASLGMALLQGMRAEMLRVFPSLDDSGLPRGTASYAPKLLDTNVIIDGRIADLCRTGFVEGTVFVPNFVLNELQYIADSADAMRRARGRRGLETLNTMREMSAQTVPANGSAAKGEVQHMPVVQVLTEIPASVAKIETVDAKLVELAKELHGSIITNDFNLNRVAELQGVTVLNLNQLTLALKPVVLPGEEMSILIVREGKEANQGVGYLEDGTMVVVGDGREHIGQTCKIVISQVIQTVAGKMIFSEMKAPPGIKGAGDDLFESAVAKIGGKSGDDLPGRAGGGLRRKSRS